MLRTLFDYVHTQSELNMSSNKASCLIILFYSVMSNTEMILIMEHNKMYMFSHLIL